MDYKAAIVRFLGTIEDKKTLETLCAMVCTLSKNREQAFGPENHDLCGKVYELLRFMSPVNAQRVYDYTYRLFLKDSGTEG